MTPTSTGRHCAVCQTEVVDFTQMTQTEIINYLAARGGQRVCVRVATLIVPVHPKRPKGPRRWLLAAAVLLGWQPTWAQRLPPQFLPKVALFTTHEKIIVRGVVLDDSLNVPLSGTYVFINGTKYGTITDEHGSFTMWLPTDWEPIKAGMLTLYVTSDPFTFLNKLVKVDLTTKARLTNLIIRLLSDPERGIVMGKAKFLEPPIVPPLHRKSGD